MITSIFSFSIKPLTSPTGSMPEEYGSGGCCRCCCGFIFTSGLTALFMWLTLRTSNPTLSIHHFYVPALNKTDNPNNHTIYFDLKLENEMKEKGVHYANISLNFFYNSSIPVANYTVREFYQGHKKHTHRRGWVDAAGLPWAAAREVVSNGGTVSFRVRVDSRVKFKIMGWYTKRRSLEVVGDVAVNESGGKVKKKNVKLGSGAGDPVTRWVMLGPVVVFTLYVILFL